MSDVRDSILKYARDMLRSLWNVPYVTYLEQQTVDGRNEVVDQLTNSHLLFAFLATDVPKAMLVYVVNTKTWRALICVSITTKMPYTDCDLISNFFSLFVPSLITTNEQRPDRV